MHAVPVLGSGSVPLHVYVTRFGRLLRLVSPDLIFVHNEPYAASTFQVAWANARTVGRPIGFYSAQNICKRYPPPFTQAEQWVYRQATFGLPITGEVCEVLRKKGFTGAAPIITVGYDGIAYQASDDVRKRHLSVIRTGEPCILMYAGRLVEEKGLRTLFAALALLSGRPGWRLDVIGGGPLESELRALAEREGFADRIRWRGFITQDAMPEVYRSVHVVVLPSETRTNWKEQFGRVLVEAMASGTPVVGSDSGEIPAVINSCGGGIIFPETDARQLAAALIQLIDDPERRAALAIAGTQGAKAFTWDRAADRMADAFKAAVNTSGNL